jgi:hypothetical protein
MQKAKRGIRYEECIVHTCDDPRKALTLSPVSLILVTAGRVLSDN